MASYKRIILKLSGEALAGDQPYGIDTPTINALAQEIKTAALTGLEIAIVVGAGNIWRGKYGSGMDRASADYMGMLATTINALALQDALERIGIPTRVQTAIEMRQIAEPYIRRKAERHLEKGRIVIFACGTGNPYFTTDTTAALRGAEIEADLIMKATNVDGVYTSDPKGDPTAKRYRTISYMDVLDGGLKVMDTTAIALCMDNKIPIMVFSMREPGNIIKAVSGQSIGTLISPDVETVQE